ncbi:MAG: SpaA isopeptide-forming pilin-related protein [Oscillospiraceae bacterium]
MGRIKKCGGILSNFNERVHSAVGSHKTKRKQRLAAAVLSGITAVAVSASLIFPAISATKIGDGTNIADAKMLVGTQGLTNLGLGTDASVSDVISAANDKYALGIASQFSVFLNGEFKSNEADCEGRLAASGNIDVRGYDYGTENADGYRIAFGHYMGSSKSDYQAMIDIYGSDFAHAICGGWMSTEKIAYNPGNLSAYTDISDQYWKWRKFLVNGDGNNYYQDRDDGSVKHAMWTKASDVLNFKQAFNTLSKRSQDVKDLAMAKKDAASDDNELKNTVTLDASTKTVTFHYGEGLTTAESVVFNLTEEQLSTISSWYDGTDYAEVNFKYENIPALPTPLTGWEYLATTTEKPEENQVRKETTWDLAYIVVNVEGTSVKLPDANVVTSITGQGDNAVTHIITNGKVDPYVNQSGSGSSEEAVNLNVFDSEFQFDGSWSTQSFTVNVPSEGDYEFKVGYQGDSNGWFKVEVDSDANALKSEGNWMGSTDWNNTYYATNTIHLTAGSHTFTFGGSGYAKYKSATLSKGGSSSSGTLYNFNNKFGCSSLLYNMADATSVTLAQDFQGTVLAPKASVGDHDKRGGGSAGHLSGALVAKTFDGSTEFGYRPYLGPSEVFPKSASANYNVNFQKTDAAGNPLAGAKISLYELSQGISSTITTTTDVDAIPVKVGKYYTQEVKAPSGYIYDNTPQNFFEVVEGDKVTSGEISHTTTIYTYSTIGFKDVSFYNQNPSANVESIEVRDSTSTYQLTGHEISDNNGWYQIAEIKGPVSKLTVKFSAAISDNAKNSLRAYDTNENEITDDFKSKVTWSDDNKTLTYTYDDTPETSTTTTTDTYEYCPTVTIKTYGNLTDLENSSNAVSNQTIDIYDINNCSYTINGVTKKASEWKDNLPAGYTCVQISGNQYFFFSGDSDEPLTPSVNLNEAANISNFTMTNELLPTPYADLGIKKVDENGNELEGAKFDLYAVDGSDVLLYKDISVGNISSIAEVIKNNYSSVQNNSDEKYIDQATGRLKPVITEDTDTGNVTYSDRYYYLVETQAPNNCKTTNVGNKINFKVGVKESRDSDSTTKIGTTTFYEDSSNDWYVYTIADSATVGLLTVTNEKIPTADIQLKKIDKDSNEALSGATFSFHAVKDGSDTTFGTVTLSGNQETLSSLLTSANITNSTYIDAEYKLYPLNGNNYYYLKEESAPSGWVKNDAQIKFTVADDGTVTGSDVSGFATWGDGTDNLKLVTITNEREKGNLIVQKLWKDSNGNSITDSNKKVYDLDGKEIESITVTVYRQAEGSSKETFKVLTLNASNNWQDSTSLTNLLLVDTNGNKYTYSIEEALPSGNNFAGFTTTYSSEGLQLVKDSTETITVTNTEPVKVSLPETGGMGRTIPYIIGGLIVILSATGLVIKQRNKKLLK